MEGMEGIEGIHITNTDKDRYTGFIVYKDIGGLIQRSLPKQNRWRGYAIRPFTRCSMQGVLGLYVHASDKPVAEYGLPQVFRVEALGFLDDEAFVERDGQTVAPDAW